MNILGKGHIRNFYNSLSHLYKETSDSNLRFLTLFSRTVFYALSHVVIRFVRSARPRNHFLSTRIMDSKRVSVPDKKYSKFKGFWAFLSTCVLVTLIFHGNTVLVPIDHTLADPSFKI